MIENMITIPLGIFSEKEKWCHSSPRQWVMVQFRNNTMRRLIWVSSKFYNSQLRRGLENLGKSLGLRTPNSARFTSFPFLWGYYMGWSCIHLFIHSFIHPTDINYINVPGTTFQELSWQWRQEYKLLVGEKGTWHSDAVNICPRK